MKKLAATRTFDTYDPDVELREHYPDWQVHRGLPGAQGDSWVSFQPDLKIIVINPDLPPPDRSFAKAFALALLDSGFISPGAGPVPPDVLADCEDIALIRLGHRHTWEAVT